MTINKQDIINRKILNINKILINTENIGNEISNELNVQSQKLKLTNNKSNSIYEKLLLSRDKINKISLSLPTLNFKFNFKEQKKNTENIYDILNEISNNDEMDEISSRLHTLKNMAIDINSQIKSQNIILDEISYNQSNCFEVISENNHNIKKIL